MYRLIRVYRTARADVRLVREPSIAWNAAAARGLAQAFRPVSGILPLCLKAS
jgi:hypothetical protein